MSPSSKKEQASVLQTVLSTLAILAVALAAFLPGDVLAASGTTNFSLRIIGWPAAPAATPQETRISGPVALDTAAAVRATAFRAAAEQTAPETLLAGAVRRPASFEAAAVQISQISTRGANAAPSAPSATERDGDGFVLLSWE